MSNTYDVFLTVGLWLIGISVGFLTIITLAMKGGHHSTYDLAGATAVTILVPLFAGAACIVFWVVASFIPTPEVEEV